MNRYLDIAPEVAEALAAGKPVVALESTIISHGMPYPQNVETALKVEQIIRDAGAVPATIAIIGGRLKAARSKRARLFSKDLTSSQLKNRQRTRQQKRELKHVPARFPAYAAMITKNTR